MKAAWDWFMPRTTGEERQQLVELAAGLGFDMLIVGNPCADLTARAHDLGLRVAAVVSPVPDAEFRSRHNDCLQRMLPAEDAMLHAVETAGTESFQRLAHRWFPLIQGSELVCYEHGASREFLKSRVAAAAETADGIALDGFGFRNHYACFCGRCRELHGGEDPGTMAAVSEASLIGISEIICKEAKNIRTDFLVTNHVWPPFNPNPGYGCRLKLDYCTQTISWFYKPEWSLERVELEASTHKRLENPDRNSFVPFIGLYHDAYQTRKVERIRAELKIAARYGNGSLAFCTLEAPFKDPEMRAVLRDIMKPL